MDCKKNKIPTLLVDLDCTLVDMLPPWIHRYNEIKGTEIALSDIKDYDVGLVCTDQKTLYGILDEPGFFFNMEPMPGAVKYFQKLVDDGYRVLIVTQPPRRAEMAVRDKRRWVSKYFKNYDLMNMFFCHHKEQIRGDVLFDDKPAHLEKWKQVNPDGLTATLDWKYNTKSKVDFRGDLVAGWEQFYDWVHKTFPIT